MIRAKVCDPASKLGFMEFIRGTTCILSVPHGADSELWVSTDQSCTLAIEAAGQELQCVEIHAPGGSIHISELRQPLARNVFSVSRLLQALRFEQPSVPTQRLYNFRALIHSGTPAERGDLLATFDFHLLCEVDFHWARAYHLEESNTPEAVTTRAEGTCPHCQEIRNRLERQWRYEI